MLRALAGNHDHSIESVDLSEARHLKPYSVACVAALGSINAGNPTLVMPEDAECREHLCRLGLPMMFGECNAGVTQRPTNLAVRQIKDFNVGSERFADEFVELMRADLAGDDSGGGQLAAGVSQRLATSLDEVVRNALSHAASQIGCVVVGQGFPGSQTVEMAIVDCGIGIRAHLAQNKIYTSRAATDAEAIVLATEEGVTGTEAGASNIYGEPNSGAGLAEMRQYSESGGCDLSIASGDAIVCFGADGAPITHRFYGRFPGTLVNIRFFVGGSPLTGKGSDVIDL